MKSTGKKFLKALYGRRNLNTIRDIKKDYHECSYEIGKTLNNLRLAKENPKKYSKEFIRLNKVNLSRSKRLQNYIRKNYSKLFDSEVEQLTLKGL